MGWALVIIFVVLQGLAYLAIRSLDRKFGINDRVDSQKQRMHKKAEDNAGESLPRQRRQAPLTFMIWLVAAFVNFFIALTIAALYFS